MDDADLGDSDWRDARRAAPLPADENSVARRLRLLAEERSGAPPPLAGIPSAVQSSDGPSNAQVMTSLSAVLAGLARLEEKVDALGARLDGLQRAGSSTPAAPMAAPSPPSPPPPPPAAPVAPSPPPASTPAAPPSTKVEWDGEVDEEAYFDVDEEDADLGDWRDVRRLNRLFKKDED